MFKHVVGLGQFLRTYLHPVFQFFIDVVKCILLLLNQADFFGNGQAHMIEVFSKCPQLVLTGYRNFTFQITFGNVNGCLGKQADGSGDDGGQEQSGQQDECEQGDYRIDHQLTQLDNGSKGNCGIHFGHEGVGNIAPMHRGVGRQDRNAAIIILEQLAGTTGQCLTGTDGFDKSLARISECRQDIAVHRVEKAVGTYNMVRAHQVGLAKFTHAGEFQHDFINLQVRQFQNHRTCNVPTLKLYGGEQEGHELIARWCVEFKIRDGDFCQPLCKGLAE